MLPLLDYKELDDDEKIFGESYDSEDQSQMSERSNSQILEQQYGSEEGEMQSQ